MKKIYGLAALCAAMTLASCSNENEPAPVNTGKTEVAYFKVNIKNPGEVTRAHDDYVIGSTEENGANKATFVFFKSNGDYAAIAKDVDLKDVAMETSGNIEEKNTSIIKIERVNGVVNSDIEKVIVILNPTSAINTAVSGQRESAILSLSMADYGTADGSENSFIMTNSVWDESTGAQSCKDAIYEDYMSAANATATPVYVERVVARVDGTVDANIGLFKEEGGEIKSGAKVKIDGVDTEIKIVPQGYEVYYAAQKSNLIKNVTFTSDPFAGWSVAGDYRSHWANVTGLGDTDLKTAAYKDITTTPSNNKFSMYVQENTLDAKYPVILMTAQLQDKENNPVKLVRLVKNTLYYTEDNAKTQLVKVLQTLGYKVKTDENGSTRDLVETDMEWVADASKDWTGYLGLKTLADSDIVDENGDIVKGGFTETVLKEECKVWKWTDGKCYYYKEITNGTKPGVVRNHIYDLTISSVVGLGTPVFNPDSKTIVPEKPSPLTPSDDQWYFNCTINILSWVRYSQTVEFN